MESSAAYQAGALMGLICAGTFGALCGLIPLSVGMNYRQPILGIAGFVTSVVGGFLIGIFVLPVSLVFMGVIFAVHSSMPRRRSRRLRRHYDDLDDRRPRRRRFEDEDDLPRRWSDRDDDRHWDHDGYRPEGPRRRRYHDD